MKNYRPVSLLPILKAKLSTDNTSPFSVIHNFAASSASLNDLLGISWWAYQWKIIFNPDVSKLAQKIVFSRKASATNLRTIYFINACVRENTQKHLGLSLDSKLNISDYINEKIKKATKGVNVIRKMNLLLPHSFLLTIYK